ncbi:glycosyltransferase [Bacillus pacificus]|uniref:glycosyltransferase n=1 Tax=Bacillus pacificus TaxID=2026187 RepID=UPI002E1F92F1|nr:glycosyltransferase [Bacillus pacificus]
MKVSVVMTTYNGEKYVCEQLNSIYRQTQPPNEVIICDDCSTDKTAQIINEFIEKHNLTNWIFSVNQENKGWQRNFLEAMEKATGDILFLCDQDDVWLNDKIECMTNVIKSNDKVKCLAGNIVTIDENGEVFNNKHGYSLGDNTNRVTPRPFAKDFNTITILGCSLCLTRELAKIIRELNVKNYSHDSQTCRLATLLDGMYLIDKRVIKYRIHNSNTSGVAAGIGFGSANVDKRIRTIKENIQWLEALLNYYKASSELSSDKLSVILKTKEMQERRCIFLASRNPFQYIKLIKYRDYYSNASMLIGDFAYCYGINKWAGKILWFLKKRH